MKTASELAIEYWNKPPIERVNNTLQDYVYDYMAQQNERNKTTRLAQEAEIARLQSGFGDLKPYCEAQKNNSNGGDWDKGWCAAHRRILIEINRITGENK